jgi:hypothetical protein
MCKDQEYETYKTSFNEFVKAVGFSYPNNQEAGPKVNYKAINELDNDRYSSREVNGMDVIDLCKHWGLDFNEGNILKYLLRKKNEDISDMEKIADYAKREIEHLIKTELNEQDRKTT